MEVKKKFLNSLKNSCIFLNKGILLLLVLILQMIFSSTCYANISESFVNYTVDNFKTNLQMGTYNNNFKTIMSSLSMNDISSITQNVNDYLSLYQLSNLTDKDCFVAFRQYTSRNPYLQFTFYDNNIESGYGNDNLANVLFRLYSTPSDANYACSNFTNQNTKPIYVVIVDIKAQNLTSIDSINYSFQILDYNDYINFNSKDYEISYTTVVPTYIFPNLSVPYEIGYPDGYVYPPGTTNLTQVTFIDKAGGYQIPTPEPEPDTPSGDNYNIDSFYHGTITNNSGELIGNFSGENDNNNILGFLTDTPNLSGEIITSGDIESALNFEIEQDPYSNFWFTLTMNLKSSLLGTKRSIDISFQGRTWTISLDQYMVLPAWLITILTPFSTAIFTWVLVRQFKLIFDKLASGNVDSLLKENSEERHF